MQSSANPSSINDIVLIREDKVTRANLKVGKFIELITSADGKSRGAKVEYVQKGSKQIINRPVDKLYPIELSSEIFEVINENDCSTIDDICIEFIDEKTYLSYDDVAP